MDTESGSTVRPLQRPPVASASTLAWLAFTGAFASRTSGTAFIASITASVVIAAFMFWAFRRSERESALRFTGSDLEFENLWGRRRTVAKRGEGEVFRVVSSDIARGKSFLFWTVNGRATLGIVESAWPKQQISELVEQLEYAVTEIPEPMSVGDIDQRFPGTLPWPAVHPQKFAFALLGAFLVVCVVATSLTS